MFGLRTDWAGRAADESGTQIADYAPTAGAWRQQVRAASGHQPGGLAQRGLPEGLSTLPRRHAAPGARTPA